MAIEKTETPEKKAKVTKTASSKNNAKGPKIYIGPNLLELTTYTVISDAVPVHIEAAIKACPSIEKLIVPIKDFSNKENKIRKKGTLEHRYYQDVIDFLNERKGDK